MCDDLTAAASHLRDLEAREARLRAESDSLWAKRTAVAEELESLQYELIPAAQRGVLDQVRGLSA